MSNFPPDENKYQIAEKILRESLLVFQLHYKEDNPAIFAAECRLSYVLALQEKWTDFDKHFALCKEGKEKHEDKSEALRNFYEMIEKALAEKGK